MESKKSVQYLQIGLISFFVLLVICIIIRPGGLSANSGISYYGVYGNTFLLYSLAFLTESVFIWRAASIMNNKTKMDRYVSIVLRIFAILLLGILITPHNVFEAQHKIMGSSLFSLQLATGIVLTSFVYRDWFNFTLLIITLLSGVASLVYLFTPDGFMIQSQIVFQISIWLIFIRSFWHSNFISNKRAKILENN